MRTKPEIISLLTNPGIIAIVRAQQAAQVAPRLTCFACTKVTGPGDPDAAGKTIGGGPAAPPPAAALPADAWKA